MTRLTFYIETPEDNRAALLDRRDVIVAKLLELRGLKVSAYDDGTVVHMADDHLSTLGDVFAGEEPSPHWHCVDRLCTWPYPGEPPENTRCENCGGDLKR